MLKIDLQRNLFISLFAYLKITDIERANLMQKYDPHALFLFDVLVIAVSRMFNIIC